jgi:phospholipid/cholesterol/gamma-HCH transport system permease protein
VELLHRHDQGAGVWLIIAAIGCFEGLQVSGSAESVGQLTTRSVVEAIFCVIVLDAVFSIIFLLAGV